MARFAPTSDTIRDAQDRLRRLGHGPLEDAAGTLGHATSVALQAFQRERGLPITGLLDAETYDRLVEAGWSLGSRLLFLSRPRLRGDDVAALQEALALLGFDSGRIDGIFGPQTVRALSDFQANCALAPTGELNRQTLAEIARLSSRDGGRSSVTDARDLFGLRDTHTRRLVVVHGEGLLADQVIEALAAVVTVVPAGARSAQEAASLANDEGAGLAFSVQEESSLLGLDICYFASYRTKSVLGEALALDISRSIGAESALPVTISGMSVPLLRETTMTALTFLLGDSSEQARILVAESIATCAGLLFDSAR